MIIMQLTEWTDKDYVMKTQYGKVRYEIWNMLEKERILSRNPKRFAEVKYRTHNGVEQSALFVDRIAFDNKTSCKADKNLKKLQENFI